MLDYLAKVLKKLKSTSLEGFDASFYAAQYPDLKGLSSERSLRNHYLKYGKHEGRYPNFAVGFARVQAQHGMLPADFDVSAYKLLNADLGNVFWNDLQYVSHYLTDGRRENRLYRFEDPRRNGFLRGWMAAFDPHFIAWASDWLSQPITSRQQAIEIFIEQGIPRLCPISLNHIFDADFYRARYSLAEGANDVALYRHWLEVGFPRGEFPSEEAALRPYIGALPFPQAFDYVSYSAFHRLRPTTVCRQFRICSMKVTSPAPTSVIFCRILLPPSSA